MTTMFFRFPLEPTWGGAEKLTFEFLSRIAGSNRKSAIYCNHLPLAQRCREGGVGAVVAWAGWEPTVWWAIFFSPLTALACGLILLRAVISHGRPETVYCTTLADKLFITPWALVIACNVVWIEHTRLGRWFFDNPFLPLYRLLSRRVRIIAPSYFLRDQLLKAKIPFDRIRIIYPGTAISDESNKTEKAVDAPTVGFLGRLAQEKGLATLIQASAYLSDQTHILIAGDGPEKKRLEQMASDEGVSQKIEFAGVINNIDDFFARIDALAVPSLEAESFGLVALEAMAHGVPVVASRIGALPEIIEHERTGLLFTPGSSDELASSLHRLLESSTLYNRLAQEARRAVKRRFRIERYVEDLGRVEA
ncbi:MAG: hypothetical protein A2722_04240 [Candidatus Doudnabacteria bacterium RIFCSPHIGHO2_01_FULL_50_11]|uniref:Glycosyl transferase family 1 domain-containing protein n=1 Tax=Candidatus Doudnabacteria bacterium RIFCSPHIGHO2_01_FULL_50_11 TaxID=1817828 RepID=A0A1F5PG42_9BACT|nr:MAG: hypothetical protein A2722_04240 [Candidatus Doudnabacteria bacterium RIFCSPHIGHO2_01_FULL_50_11]HLC44929.1 glycosyltransferase family 4 protein [Patescibacteria group bacterium]